MTTESRRITISVVERLPSGSIIWDTAVKGFGCRRQRKDPIYFLKARFGGRQRWFVIGPHGSPWAPETARNEARLLLGEAAAGRDPALARARQRGMPTLGDLAKAFLEQHVRARLKPSTAEQYARLFRNHIAAALANLPIDQVTEADVGRLHHSLSKTPYQANRALAVLSKMFSFAERHGVRAKGTNPCKGHERFRERSRERWLSDDEMARLGGVLDKAVAEGGESPFVLAALKLLLLTGARRGEILGLKWDHIDLDRGVLALPDSKTGAKLIGLNAPAIEVISSLPRVDGNPYVIVGQYAGTHLVNLTKPWLRLRTRAGLEGVRLHDLRHNFGSRAASTGHSLPIIAKQMGHAQIATTARYAHAMPEPVRRMNQAVGEQISAALGAKSGNISAQNPEADK